MNIAEHITQLKQDIDDVYAKGYEDGQASGGGGSDEYDKFWDMVQQKGNRKNYDRAFCQWAMDYWKPKYDIKPTAASYMFYGQTKIGDSYINLPEKLAEAGITLDFSEITSANGFVQMLSYTAISHFGTLNAPNAAGFTSAFIYSTQLKQLYLNIKNDGSATFAGSFTGATGLTDFQITYGKIGQDFDISPSTKLSKESITSVINALLDGAEKTVKFSLTAVNKAFETSSGANDGSSSAEWISLITPKSNQHNGTWTITLA